MEVKGTGAGKWNLRDPAIDRQTEANSGKRTHVYTPVHVPAAPAPSDHPPPRVTFSSLEHRRVELRRRGNVSRPSDTAMMSMIFDMQQVERLNPLKAS